MTQGRWRSAAFKALLLVGRALCPRNRLEATRRDRFAALDRKAVGAFLQPSFRALDRLELAAKLGDQSIVDLLLFDQAGVVGRIRGRLDLLELAASARLQPPERRFDTRALPLQQLACARLVDFAHLVISSPVAWRPPANLPVGSRRCRRTRRIRYGPC